MNARVSVDYSKKDFENNDDTNIKRICGKHHYKNVWFYL